MKKELTQQEKVVHWLKNHKYISREEAFNKLYIYNLTAVISDLRKAGYDIENVWVKGKGTRYCKYQKGKNWRA